jgi:hypothetical protein
MTTGKAVTQQQQHAPHHYSPEAIGAMTLVGVIGIVVPVAVVLVIIKLARSTLGRKRVASPPVATPPYISKAVVLCLTATAHQGNNGHDRLEVSATLNEDYQAHIRRCQQCRETIVTDLHEFAEQIDHDVDARVS